MVERLPDGCEVDADKGYQGLGKQVTLVTVRNAETGEGSRCLGCRLRPRSRSGKGQH